MIDTRMLGYRSERPSDGRWGDIYRDAGTGEVFIFMGVWMHFESNNPDPAAHFMIQEEP